MSEMKDSCCYCWRGQWFAAAGGRETGPRWALARRGGCGDQWLVGNDITQAKEPQAVEGRRSNLLHNMSVKVKNLEASPPFSESCTHVADLLLDFSEPRNLHYHHAHHHHRHHPLGPPRVLAWVVSCGADVHNGCGTVAVRCYDGEQSMLVCVYERIWCFLLWLPCAGIPHFSTCCL